APAAQRGGAVHHPDAAGAAEAPRCRDTVEAGRTPRGGAGAARRLPRPDRTAPGPHRVPVAVESASAMAKLMLVDGNSLTYRAFFALPTDITLASGQVTNAVYGFTSMLLNLVRDHKPDGIGVAFD